MTEQLSFQASHDTLTGLINRYEFERRATRLLATVKHGNNDVIKGILKEIGVDYAQGYGIGKPQPFDKLLARSNNVDYIKEAERKSQPIETA